MGRGGWRAYPIAAVLVAAGCPPALAAPERPGIPASLTERVTSQHFQVNYTTREQAHAISPETAQGVLAIAEHAYAVEVNDATGFGPPLDDGDGLVDIYVHDLAEDVALSQGDRPTPQRPNQASAYIELDPQAAVDQGPQGGLRHILPHEFFHVLQFAYSGREALWITEATAEWAARSLAGVHFYSRPEENWFRNPNQPLDCIDEGCGGTPTAERVTQGYDRWPFFRYLEERLGVRIVYEIWAQSRALSDDGAPHALEAIDAALRARGLSLSRAFGDYVTFAATGDWKLESLREWLPSPVGALRTGRGAALHTLKLQIAHLAAGYLALQGGGRAGTLSLCLPARLRLDVVQPSAQAEPPAILLDGGERPPLELRGSGAARAIDVPWDTCQDSAATMAFPNTSWSLDGAPFELSARVTPARRLWLSRRDPFVTYYLELPARARARVELTLPRERGRRRARRIVRRRSVGTGPRPLSLRLPAQGRPGRYRLSVRFRRAGVAVEARRSFRVAFR